MEIKNIQELEQYSSSKEIVLKKEIDFNKVFTIVKLTDGITQIKNGQRTVIWDNKYNIQEADFTKYAGMLKYPSSEYKYNSDENSAIYIFNLDMIERIELTNPQNENLDNSKLVVYYTNTSYSEPLYAGTLENNMFEKLVNEWKNYRSIGRKNRKHFKRGKAND